MDKKLSHINLADPNCVWQDVNAKSVSFFCKHKPVRVDQDLIRQLKEMSARHGGQNTRVCLHEDPQAQLHEMIILEYRKNYYRPHKHLKKGESYHVMEGELAVFVYDEQGEVIDDCILKPGVNDLYRIGPNIYHSVMPLTEYVIYHESNPGPFTGAQDSVFAPWSPEPGDAEPIKRFKLKLLKIIGRDFIPE